MAVKRVSPGGTAGKAPKLEWPALPLRCKFEDQYEGLNPAGAQSPEARTVVAVSMLKDHELVGEIVIAARNLCNNRRPPPTCSRSSAAHDP
jgi:hypothetical protein